MDSREQEPGSPATRDDASNQLMTGHRAGPTIRAALVLGFGLTLGLWVFTGYDVAWRMSQVQNDAAAVNARYVRAQELLSTIRSQALLASVYVRDALLDPDPAMIDLYSRRLQASSAAIDTALASYVPVMDVAAERVHVDAFRRELDDFRATLREVLATDRTRWPNEARYLLSRRIMPKRESVIRLSEDVQALNRNAYVQQQASVAAVHAAAERLTWQRLGFALAASLGIALLATLYAGRLESRLKRQREKDLQNTRDLQRLSAQLVNAQETERRTIARELHDEVGQVLSAVKVELSIAQRFIEDAGLPADTLDTAQSIADGALHTIRDLSRLLHPSVLDDLGLLAAVEAHAHTFSRRHGIRVELLHDHMEARLAPEVEVAAYRLVQEALTNVARHSQTSTCRVYLQGLPHSILVTIEDQGRGFGINAESPASSRGLGLIGIRERVAQLQGTLRLESTPGKGTRVTVELPTMSRAAPTDSAASDTEEAQGVAVTSPVPHA
jgi:signal transduction histidine kinase